MVPHPGQHRILGRIRETKSHHPGNRAKSPNYCVDRNQFFSNDKTSICVPKDPGFITPPLLNSTVLFWVFTNIAASRQGGYYEIKPMYVEPLPSPPPPTPKKPNSSTWPQNAPPRKKTVKKKPWPTTKLESIHYRLRAVPAFGGGNPAGGVRCSMNVDSGSLPGGENQKSR